MTRVPCYINVVLDVLLGRNLMWRRARQLGPLSKQGRPEGLLAAHAVTTIRYLVQK
jgi:hypothetical protein